MSYFRKSNLVGWAAGVCALYALAAGAQTAQGQMPQALPGQPLIDEHGLTRVSEHVYAIVGWPNIGIVVGNRATLVIDNGLGQRNGATILRVAQKLEQGPVLYLTTTHYHSEHVTGEQAFPANTVLIRPVVQQEEMDRRAGKAPTAPAAPCCARSWGTGRRFADCEGTRDARGDARARTPTQARGEVRGRSRKVADGGVAFEASGLRTGGADCR